MKRLHRYWNLLAALLFTIAFSGCQFDPYFDVYATQKPKQSEIIGTYALTRQNLSHDGNATSLVANDGTTATNPTISLHADGTWTAHNFPVWVGNWANKTDEWSIRKFVNGGGKWNLAVVGSIDQSDIWGASLKSKTIPADFTMQFGHQKPPHSLTLVYSDPDEGLAMIYERKNK